MDEEGRCRLEKLRVDFEENKGELFDFFFCPILHKDENTELIKGHIVNKSFSNTSRKWTIQRKDVDGFYGRHFEADFFGIEYSKADDRVFNSHLVTDKKASNIFKPKITLDGEEVDYYLEQENPNVPEKFTKIIYGEDEAYIVLKMPPEEVHQLIQSGKQLKFGASKVITIPIAVSLIKAAHLTMFSLFGYRYVLSMGGHFVGKQLLGEFFQQNKNLSKSSIQKSSKKFFKKYLNMVAPVSSVDSDCRGSIEDSKFHVCIGNNNSIWAFIVYVRTNDLIHAVMIPTNDKVENAVENAVRFNSFLENDNNLLSICSLNFVDYDHFELGSNIIDARWSKVDPENLPM